MLKRRSDHSCSILAGPLCAFVRDVAMRKARSTYIVLTAACALLQGHCIGVDEFLWLCIRWKWLVDAWKGKGEPPDESGTPMVISLFLKSALGA